MEIGLYTFAETHLLVDVSGYVPAGSDGFSSLAPARLLETRSVPGAATVLGKLREEVAYAERQHQEEHGRGRYRARTAARRG